MWRERCQLKQSTAGRDGLRIAGLQLNLRQVDQEVWRSVCAGYFCGCRQALARPSGGSNAHRRTARFHQDSNGFLIAEQPSLGGVFGAFRVIGASLFQQPEGRSMPA
jgi:hypothetical protein